jgi:hypothetical protein
MKATALMTTLGGGLALAFSAVLFAAPASANSVSNAVYRGHSPGSVPSSYYQEVRRVIIVAPPPYASDPYYYGPAYYGPSVAYVPPPIAYGYAPPPVAYAYAPPPVAYAYAPPPAAYYGPGPGIAVGY